MPHTGLRPTLSPPPRGPKFPDVSNWQGQPNWDAAKPFIAGAYAKGFEYREDSEFRYNVTSLKRVGLPWGAYDFVRFCDASGFIAVLRSVGGPTSLPPVIDMEVPAAAGCAPTLDRQIFAAFHRHPVIYTAPGTWPGGSHAGLPVWEATYGSAFSPVWHPVVAWQFTDGQWGSVVSIPGIATGDVSVDFGLLPQPQPQPAPQPKPVSLYALFATGPFPSPWGQLNERLTVERFDGAVQHGGQYRAYLRNVLQPALRFLAQRDAFVATMLHPLTSGKPSWGVDHRGARYQLLIHRAERKLA